MYKSYQIIWENLKSNKKKKRKTLGIETQMKRITKGKSKNNARHERNTAFNI